MSGSNSNLSTVDRQEAAKAAKRKEDDTTVVAQAASAPMHREQEALIAAVAATHKTLDEAWAHECAAALTWEKEKNIACHLEQQLTATQGIVLPQDNDDDCSINTGSNPDTALIVHLHEQAVGL
jgi:hypothetical protein